MTPRRLLATLSRVVRDDCRLAVEKEAPRGWYLRQYYGGRWAARRGTVPALTDVALSVCGRPVRLTLSAMHLNVFVGVFVDDQYDCRHRLVRGPRRILDLGANIGMASAYFHALWPDAEFLCVEPDPRNLQMLTDNLAKNGVRARIADCAVGPRSGSTRLRFGADPTCSAVDFSPLYSHTESVCVRMETVGDLLDGAAWDSVDLVKVDIEGAEDSLLGQNNGWLDRVGTTVLEIHPNTTLERLGSYLRLFGFGVERLGSGREPVYLATRALP